MKFHLNAFLPFLIMIAGTLIATIGGFRGYELDLRSPLQMVGGIGIAVGILIFAWRFIKQIAQWFK